MNYQKFRKKLVNMEREDIWDWVTTSTSGKEIQYNMEDMIENMAISQIEKVILTRTTFGKTKSLHIDFVV